MLTYALIVLDNLDNNTCSLFGIFNSFEDAIEYAKNKLPYRLKVFDYLSINNTRIQCWYNNTYCIWSYSCFYNNE